jgi:hypothetical protein
MIVLLQSQGGAVQNRVSGRFELSPPEYCRPSGGVSRLDMQKKGQDKVVEARQ